MTLVIIMSFNVHAQETSAPDTIHYTVPPVTITATRVSEAWIEIPMAITTLTTSELKHGKGFGMSEALGGIPGVLSQSRAGAQDERISIRGYGARGVGEKSNSGTTKGIRILVDGFPETEPDGRTSLDMLDFANAGQIDVLRSNSSVVWGNAAGGVINVLSNTMFSSPYVRAGVVTGSYGFVSERLSTGTMLGDGKFFFSMTNTTSDGYRDHSNAKQTLLNTGVVAPLGTRSVLGVYVTATSNLFRVPGPLTQAQFDFLPQQSDSAFIKVDERRYNRIGRIGVSLAHEFDDMAGISASVFAAPKFIQRSERRKFREITRYHIGGNFLYHNRFTFIPGTKDMFILGVDEAYQDGSILWYTLTPTGEKGTTLAMNKREGAENSGAFFSEEIGVNERWSFTIGGRYDNLRYFYDNYFDPPFLQEKKTFEHFTPKLGFTYSLSPTHTVYANLGGGVEIPAGNEVDPEDVFGTDAVHMLNPLLEPITSTTVEVGTKQILTLGENGWGNLTYDVAAYIIGVKNDVIPYENGNFYLTAGETRRTGAEFGARLELRNGFSLGAALSFSNNEYLSYTVDSMYYGRPGKVADYKDKQQPGVPPSFYQFDAKYAPVSLRGGFGQLRFHGVSGYYVNDANTLWIPTYMTIDAVIGIDGLGLGNSGLSISAFAGMYNVTDKVYAASAWINPLKHPVTGKYVYLESGLPRNFAASISLGWNF